MTFLKTALCGFMAASLAGCGGGGGAGGTTGAGSGDPAIPQQDPPQPGASRFYSDLDGTSGTSTLGGTILVGRTSATGTTGTINHSAQTFTASGISGNTSLGDASLFKLPAYTFAADIAIDSGTVAIVGVSTDAVDVRSTGTAAYAGDFSAQLVDGSQITATTLDWDVDVQVNFAGDGDMDFTFTGGGSDLIDTIVVSNATISGNTFAGGTITTSKNGTTNNVTGTSADLHGTFFGFDGSLLLPGEAGGAIISEDGDTGLSGVFIASAQP